MDDKWVDRFLAEAKHKAEWSKDPSTKVGAVIVGKHNQIISSGFNGFPRGIDDSPERLNVREEKYKFVVHAEMNAIFNSSLSGVSLDGTSLFIYGLPVCSECAKGVIQTGIKDVYMLFPKEVKPSWKESFKTTMEMFFEAGITYQIKHEKTH